MARTTRSPPPRGNGNNHRNGNGRNGNGKPAFPGAAQRFNGRKPPRRGSK